MHDNERESVTDPARSLRTPPHSIEAEQSVLGALMLNNDAFFEVAAVVQANDFFRPQHRIVFEAMGRLAGDNQPLDAVTVSEALGSGALLEKAGGIAYLAELVDGTPGASNVAAYARILRDRSDKRTTIRLASQIIAASFDSTEEPRDIGPQLQQLNDLQAGRSVGGPRPVGAWIFEAQAVLDAAASDTGPKPVVSGLTDLDKVVGGFGPGHLVVVGARPGCRQDGLGDGRCRPQCAGRPRAGGVLQSGDDGP